MNAPITEKTNLVTIAQWKQGGVVDCRILREQVTPWYYIEQDGKIIYEGDFRSMDAWRAGYKRGLSEETLPNPFSEATPHRIQWNVGWLCGLYDARNNRKDHMKGVL